MLDKGERISSVEDTIDKIDALAKEKVKAYEVITQHFQEIWGTMRRPKQRIKWIEEECQLKSIERV